MSILSEPSAGATSMLCHCSEESAWRYGLADLGGGKGLDELAHYLIARETLPDEGEIAQGEAGATVRDSQKKRQLV